MMTLFFAIVTDLGERAGQIAVGLLGGDKTDNTLQVRDGYVSPSARGHAQALPTLPNG
jgi:hypothetical protein